MNPLDKLFASQSTLITAYQNLQTSVGNVVADYEERLAQAAQVPQGPAFSNCYPAQGERGWGDSIRWRKETFQNLRDSYVISSARSGIMHDNQQSTTIPVDIRNTNIFQGPYPTAWGIRLYSASLIAQGLGVYGIGMRTEEDAPQDGHPLYINASELCGLYDCRFVGNAGNVQVVSRPHESYTFEDLTVRCRNVTFNSNSWNAVGGGGGGAAQLALYCGTAKGTDVILERCDFRHTQPLPDLSGAARRGHIVLDPLNGGFFNGLVIQQSFVDCPFKSDRSTIQVSGTSNVNISTSVFSDSGGNGVIDIDPKHALREVTCKSLRTSGNTGSAVPIRVRGEIVGTTKDTLNLSF